MAAAGEEAGVAGETLGHGHRQRRQERRRGTDPGGSVALWLAFSAAYAAVRWTDGIIDDSLSLLSSFHWVVAAERRLQLELEDGSTA